MKGTYSTCDKGHYVYKYVLNNEVIYIGKTDTSLDSRIAQHGKSGDNIPSSAWKDINSSDVYYVTLNNSTMSDVVESELIRRHKPKYNVAKKSDWSGLPFPEPKWIKYEPQPQQALDKKETGKKQRRTKEERYVEDVTRAYEHNADARRVLPYLIARILDGQYEKKKFNIYKNYFHNFLAIRAPEWVSKGTCLTVERADYSGWGIYAICGMYYDGKNLFLSVHKEDLNGLEKCCDHLCRNIRQYSDISNAPLDEEYILKLSNDMKKLDEILESVSLELAS